MQIRLSLKQIWTLIVLVAVIVPVTIVMIWYSSTMYKFNLNSALIIERQANEYLKNQIESEIGRFKTLIKSKSDSLPLLIDTLDNKERLKQINRLLSFMVERESAINCAVLLDLKGQIIAAIDSSTGLYRDKKLSDEEKYFISERLGFNDDLQLSEVLVQSVNKDYISSLIHYKDKIVFKIAVAVEKPARAILVIEIDAEKFLQLEAHKKRRSGINITHDYILDRRGALITDVLDSEYKTGDLMTHLEITRSALNDDGWSADVPYVGAIGQPVYGVLTIIPSLNWTLVSEVSVSKIIQPIWVLLLEMFLVTSSVMMAFVWFVLHLARETLKPIQYSCEAIDHVARGDYDFSLKPVGIPELDAMTAGIIRMTKARQEAENALHESEQDLVITLNSIGDAVIACDENGLVTRMNPVAEQLTGWKVEEAYGQSMKSVFSVVNASTREPIENPVDKVLAKGEIVYLSNDTTLISKNGREYQIADSAAPIRNENGEILGMVLVFNDVTEQYQLRKARIETEERFSQFAENVNEVFWIGSPDWNQIHYISPAYEKVWGHSSQDLYRNPRIWMDAVYPDDREQVIDDIPKDISDIGEYVDFKKYRIKKKDGKILWIKARAYPIRDNNGQIIRVAGIAEDITEQVSMEESLRRSQKMDALGKLTGGIAHDYNNMLGVILGYTELLEEALKAQPKLAGYANRINKAGLRGAKLTKKLLSFSKQKNTDAECVNINELLNDMQHMLEKILTVRIKLELDLEKNIWPVWLSSDEMEDVILNVVINAMHAIKGNGLLTIKSHNEKIDSFDSKFLGLAASGDYLRLSISDTGCGMDNVTKEKIFDPFFSTKGDKGTGLGLSQVYGFIDRCKGAIKVYSEPGKGSRFVFYIPRYMKVSQKVIAVEKNKIVTSQGNEKILVVDDEQALLDLNCEMLMLHNYRVFPAENAKRALEILQTEHIDLMLSDVIMPEMNGFELAAIVQKKYPNVKIQLASGFTDNRNKDMVDYNLQKQLLSKPFNSQELLQRIRVLLDN